ncbi:MAG TPA: hypothetical protein VEA81_02985 [Burkholderiaceae bacterium]|nr:hypothetical protein [Burkholderiaceae bacterium]
MPAEPLVVDVDDPQRSRSLKRVCLIDYALHIAGPLLSMGFLSVIALIVNYIKRDDARGTVYESHMSWMIRTFWWTVFWIVVSFLPALVLSVITFGLLSFLFVVPVIWYLYRMIKGVLRLNDDRPMPA